MTKSRPALYFCKDSYKAAYLMLHGAKIEEVRVKKLLPLKALKKQYQEQWTFLLSGARQKHIRLASDGKAVCNVDDLKFMRTKIKRLIKKAKVQLVPSEDAWSKYHCSI